MNQNSCHLSVAQSHHPKEMPRTAIQTPNSQPASRNVSPTTDNQQPATSHPSGFTFIEVLFAVILLGIGFIMIAAVFPVAIQQTAVVSDETQGTALARDAIRKIQAAADATVAGTASTSTLFPTTGTAGNPHICAITTNPPPSMGSTLISYLGSTNVSGLLGVLGADSFFSADHRYAWVAFYRRDSITTPFAQVYVIALQNPNFPNYVWPNVANATSIASPVPPPIPPNPYGTPPPQNAPIGAAQFFYDSTNQVTTVCMPFNPMANPPQNPNGVTGAYILIGGNVNLAPSAPAGAGPNFVGRFFRLGTVAPQPSGMAPNSSLTYQYFYLQPGSDITPAEATTDKFTTLPAVTPAITADLWCIGAAPAANTDGNGNTVYSGNPTGTWTGPNQDIGVASGFIRVNTSNN